MSRGLVALVTSVDPAGAVVEARAQGLICSACPELECCFGYDQHSPYHELDLGEHLLKTLEFVADYSYDTELRLAALLHDIGKPFARWSDGELTRYRLDAHGRGVDHAAIGASIVERRLVAVDIDVDYVCSLVATHHRRARSADMQLLQEADLAAKRA